MDKKLKIAFFLLMLFGLVTIGSVLFYADGIVLLSPKGEIAQRQKELFHIANLLMLIVVIPALVLTFFISWRYRHNNKKAKYNPEWSHSNMLELIWWGVPFAIITVLGVITWISCHRLDPFKPLDSDRKPLTVQVIALEWKWLFIYPEQGIATVNYLQIPEKTPINFEITADAPMNSFWIPALGGQIYAMAGMNSKLHLIASGVGSYRGCSSNFSGSGFSGMTFETRSTTEEDFQTWVQDTQSSASLTADVYESLLKPTSYDPPAYYRLESANLFDDVMMKYMVMD